MVIPIPEFLVKIQAHICISLSSGEILTQRWTAGLEYFCFILLRS
jgi:hypothetical protein